MSTQPVDTTVDTPAGCSATRHGDRESYLRHHCRCPEALRSATRYTKRWRLAQARAERWMLPADGTRRRVRALMAIGWSLQTQAEQAGISRSELLRVLAAPDAARPGPVQIRRKTWVRVTAVYDRLSGTRGPSRRAAAAAARYGYPPPAAWDDDAIDDPRASPAPWRRAGSPGKARREAG